MYKEAQSVDGVGCAGCLIILRMLICCYVRERSYNLKGD
jgi:hypothetical protein